MSVTSALVRDVVVTVAALAALVFGTLLLPSPPEAGADAVRPAVVDD